MTVVIPRSIKRSRGERPFHRLRTPCIQRFISTECYGGHRAAASVEATIPAHSSGGSYAKPVADPSVAPQARSHFYKTRHHPPWSTTPMHNHITAIRTVPVPREVFFDAWISADHAVPPVATVAFGRSVGESVTLETSSGDVMRGLILTMERPTHLRYTWHWTSSEEETMVDVRLHDMDERSVVEIGHAGFLTEHSAEIHLRGWYSYVDGVVDLINRSRL